MAQAVWLGAGLALIALTVWVLSDEFNLRAITGSAGATRAQAALGLPIGMPAAQAAARLEDKGLVEFQDDTPAVPCLNGVYAADETVRLFADDSWRRGTVCLASREGRISQIVWRFAPLTP